MYIIFKSFIGALSMYIILDRHWCLDLHLFCLECRSADLPIAITINVTIGIAIVIATPPAYDLSSPSPSLLARGVAGACGLVWLECIKVHFLSLVYF